MSNNEKIPFLDLVTPHKELEQELTAVFQKVIGTAGFVGGPMVENFENEFAAYCDSKYCVGVASGTDAVRFPLMAAGVQPGDVVVTVPHTFIATTEAISQAGARADFVDIDEKTYSMDVEKLKEYFERECYLDRETGSRITGNSVRRSRQSFRFTSMANVRTWIQFWNWRPATT
jgi:dTDP-4-amino-4,6-dideoxygalactose transaminase